MPNPAILGLLWRAFVSEGPYPGHFTPIFKQHRNAGAERIRGACAWHCASTGPAGSNCPSHTRRVLVVNWMRGSHRERATAETTRRLHAYVCEGSDDTIGKFCSAMGSSPTAVLGATLATPWRRVLGPCRRTRGRRTLVGRSHDWL
jgi:hypothetical protein